MQHDGKEEQHQMIFLIGFFGLMINFDFVPLDVFIGYLQVRWVVVVVVTARKHFVLFSSKQYKFSLM